MSFEKYLATEYGKQKDAYTYSKSPKSCFFDLLLFMWDAILPTSQILLLKRGNQACLKVHQKPVDNVAVLSRKAFSQHAGPVSPCWKWTFFWYFFSSSTFSWLFCLMRHEIWLQEVWPPKHKMHDSIPFSFLRGSVPQYECWHSLYSNFFKSRKEVAWVLVKVWVVVSFPGWINWNGFSDAVGVLFWKNSSGFFFNRL